MLGIDIDADDIIRGFAVLNGELEREMHGAMAESGKILEREGRALAPKVTGQLAAHVHGEAPQGRWTSGTLEGGVRDGADYALAVHDGARPHRIYPRNASVLAWPSGSGMRFARYVNHPGNRPNPFLEMALELRAPEIEAQFGNAFDMACERAGFGR